MDWKKWHSEWTKEIVEDLGDLKPQPNITERYGLVEAEKPKKGRREITKNASDRIESAIYWFDSFSKTLVDIKKEVEKADPKKLSKIEGRLKDLEGQAKRNGAMMVKDARMSVLAAKMKLAGQEDKPV